MLWLASVPEYSQQRRSRECDVLICRVVVDLYIGFWALGFGADAGSTLGLAIRFLVDVMR